MRTRKFVVSCDHVAPKYAMTNETVTVEQSDYDKKWGWFHRFYGCSKSYATPVDAIIGMLGDHACTNIRIDPQF